MRQTRSIVDPNRHASGGQRIDATCASARCRLVGDHPNINATLFGPDQRPNDAGTDRQAVGRNEDLSLRVVDGADGECRAILFRRKTDGDHTRHATGCAAAAYQPFRVAPRSQPGSLAATRACRRGQISQLDRR
jgi:hypothetical protein